MIKLIILLFLISCDFSPVLHQKILDAQSKISEQKYAEAAASYENIVKGYLPKEIRVKVYFQLAELYSIYLQRYIDAVKYYKKITEITYDPLWLVKVEEKMAEINFHYIKNYKNSIENYLKLTNFRPKLNRYDYYENQLATAYFYDGQLTKATELFSKIEAEKGHDFFIKSYYYLGLIHFQQKDWQKAINFWREYIKMEPKKDNITQVKFLIANAYETMENLKGAYNLYYSLLGEYPNTKVLQNRLNSIYERQVARKR